MESINKIQNTNHCIELLAAQRVIYREAKKYRTIRIVGSFGLTIIAPVVILFFPELKITLGIVGGIWTIMAFLISARESSKVKEAATIQEEFDTLTFELDWNNIQCGSKVSNEIIHSSASKYIDKSDLKNWYGDLDGITTNLSILICQRSNLVWDWRLRKQFAWTIIIALLILFGLGLGISLYHKLTLQTYLISILLPSASAFILGIKEVKEHFDSAKSKEALEKKINSMWEKSITSLVSPTKLELRQVQDKIYQLRTNTALIPEWWYDTLKGDFEKSMQNTIDRYRNEAKNKNIT
jgi:hypothetical protein